MADQPRGRYTYVVTCDGKVIAEDVYIVEATLLIKAHPEYDCRPFAFHPAAPDPSGVRDAIVEAIVEAVKTGTGIYQGG